MPQTATTSMLSRSLFVLLIAICGPFASMGQKNSTKGIKPAAPKASDKAVNVMPIQKVEKDARGGVVVYNTQSAAVATAKPAQNILMLEDDALPTMLKELTSQAIANGDLAPLSNAKKNPHLAVLQMPGKPTMAIIKQMLPKAKMHWLDAQQARAELKRLGLPAAWAVPPQEALKASKERAAQQEQMQVSGFTASPAN